MPEGPETLKQIDQMVAKLKPDGSWLNFFGIDCFGKRYASVNLEVMRRCMNLPLVDVYCKGKEYFIEFAEDVSIWAHHMRAGKWLFGDVEDQAILKNIHFSLYFGRLDPESGMLIENSLVKMHFSNPSFGRFEVFDTPKQLQDKLNELAPGFIGRFQHTQETWNAVYPRLGKKRLLIKLLRDTQKDCCSGIGNYLTAEIFHVLRFHPKITISAIDKQTWIAMFDTIKGILDGHYNGIRVKAIYKQTNAPSGAPIINEQVSGRTMWWVPTEQIIGAPVE